MTEENNNLQSLYNKQLSERFVKSLLSNLKQFSYFIKQLTKINIQAQYRRSFIGLLWLFILPLLAVIVWILMNHAGVLSPGTTGIPYPAFVLLSTSIWGFFLEIFKTSSTILSNHGRMMIMSPLPPETFIAERIIVHSLRFTIPFITNLVVLLLFGVKFSWWSIFFPISLIPLLLFGLSIGLITSMFRIIAVDFSNLIDEGMKFLMFLTPVVYAPNVKNGWLELIITWNPLTYLIGFSRDLLIHGSFYHPNQYFGLSLVSILLFILTLRYYKKVHSKVLERLIDS